MPGNAHCRESDEGSCARGEAALVHVDVGARRLEDAGRGYTCSYKTTNKLRFRTAAEQIVEGLGSSTLLDPSRDLQMHEPWSRPVKPFACLAVQLASHLHSDIVDLRSASTPLMHRLHLTGLNI